MATLQNDYATLKNDYKKLEARVSSNEEKINENDYGIRDLDDRVTVDGKDITALDLSVQRMSSTKLDKEIFSNFNSLKTAA